MNVMRYNFLIPFTIFFYSLFISSYYVNGDQNFYSDFYANVQFLDIYNGYIYYNYVLSSSEPIYFGIVWIFTFLGVSHGVFIALFNSILSFLILKLFSQWKVNLFIRIITIYTNFYLLVLFFSAERLKFGILFFLLSIIYSNNFVKLTAFVSFSIMAHIQMFLIYISVFFGIYLKKIYNQLKLAILSGILISFNIFILYDQIILKLNAYSLVVSFDNYYKILVFLLMSLYYSRNKMETILMFFPLFVAIYFVGDIRINMFGYFIFLYYALQSNKGVNVGVVLSSVYFAVKSVMHLYNIFIYGNGFV